MTDGATAATTSRAWSFADKPGSPVALLTRTAFGESVRTSSLFPNSFGVLRPRLQRGR